MGSRQQILCEARCSCTGSGKGGERVAESGILACGECGERGWQAIGRHGAHSGKPGLEVRGVRGEARGGDRVWQAVKTNTSTTKMIQNDFHSYNNQRRDQLQAMPCNATPFSI